MINNESAVDQVIHMSNLEMAKLNFAPDSHWSTMSDTAHFVQFYESDGFLLNSLSGFIGSAIESNDAAIVIATETHRKGLDELFLANGLGLTGASSRGHYIALDAADTLSQFMVDF